MADQTRVLIVEDHLILAEGLALALGRCDDLLVVGLAGSVAEAVALADQEVPHVVLMDYHLPDGTGAQAALAIRRRLPEAAIVMLTADASDEVLMAAVEAGACGFLLKSNAAAQVIEAVRRAADGEMLIPAATLARLIGRQREQARRQAERSRLLEKLTPRELEVLALMARGLDNRAIAHRLVLSYATVRGHVQNILSKLDAHSKLEAVARAVEYGLLDL